MPDSTLYYVDGEHSVPALLNKIKAYFVPQNRTINGKTLGSNVTLTPSDVGAVGMTAVTVTLTSGGWASKKQTVTVAGVMADTNIIVTPAPTSYLNYHKWKVRATGQTDNHTVEFTTDGTPSSDLYVQILVLDGVN